MEKRAQVTAYIIISLLIVGIIVGFFMINNSLFVQNSDDPVVAPIYSFVQGCIHDVGEEAVYSIGRSGGYFVVEEPALEGSIAYYLHDNQNYMPTREKVEKELSTYMDFMLPFCLNDFENFHDFTIRGKEILTSTHIDTNAVVFTVDYPLTIRKGENSYSLNNFQDEISVRLGEIYDAVFAYMQEQMKRTDAVCATCLYTISEQYDVHFQVLDTNKSDTLLFAVRDEHSTIMNENYEYYFVNKLEKIR